MASGSIRLTAVAALVAGVAASGCLVKETSNTLRLEPGGAVAWTVLERDIHASADTAIDRTREEEEFMAAVRAGTHPKASAFRALGAEDVRTQIVSARW